MGMVFSSELPATIRLKDISFYSAWNDGPINFKQIGEKPSRTFVFGYANSQNEGERSRVVAIIEEHDDFPVETRSMIWRISEIDVERQDGWLIFSRTQNDFSTDALRDFVVDTKNYRDHLRDQNKRLSRS